LATSAVSLLACGLVATTAQAVTFGNAVNSGLNPPGSQPIAVANGDFNGNGIQDLVGTNGNSAAVTATFGAGNGFFSSGAANPTTSVSASVAVADFNGDGNLDGVTANRGGGSGVGNRQATILLGAGTGAFTTTNISVPGGGSTSNQSPFTVVTGDFNSDGIPDLVFGNGGPSDAFGNAVIMLGNGDGTSFTQSQSINTGSGSTPRAITTGDVNGDGLQDLVVATQADDDVRVLLGQGDGTFANASGSPFQLDQSQGHLGPRDIVLGDWNKDGKPDFATSDNGGPINEGQSVRRTSVYLGDGNGGFTAAPGQPFTLTNPPFDVTTADYDGDGNPDLAFGQNNQGNPDPSLWGGVDVLLGDGTGGFSAPTHLPDDQLQTIGLVSGDWDNDGKPDLAAASPQTSGIDAFLNTTSPYPAPAVGSVLIDQLRFTGANGDEDQYVTLYNTSQTGPINVGGWQLQTSNGQSVTIPYSTVIPSLGYLNLAAPLNTAPIADGYSLNDYGPGTLELPYGDNGNLKVPTNGGVRLVSPFGTTIDAAGFAGNPGFIEGTGIPVTSNPSGQQIAWMRRTLNGFPQDTSDNATDFQEVASGDAAGDPSFGTPVLGAPAPASLTSPTQHNDILQQSLFSPSDPANSPPNVVTSPGKVVFNFTITNCSGPSPPQPACANAPARDAMTVTRLRFRISALSTLGTANPAAGDATLYGTDVDAQSGLGIPAMALDVPPSEAGRGGVGSSWTDTANLPSGGLAPGDSIPVAFQFANPNNGGRFFFAYQALDDLKPGGAPQQPPTSPPSGPTGESPTPGPPVPPVVAGTISPNGNVTVDSGTGAAAAAPGLAGVTAPTVAPKTKKSTKKRCPSRVATKGKKKRSTRCSAKKKHKTKGKKPKRAKRSRR
jgi:hypothetical protein